MIIDKEEALGIIQGNIADALKKMKKTELSKDEKRIKKVLTKLSEKIQPIVKITAEMAIAIDENYRSSANDLVNSMR